MELGRGEETYVYLTSTGSLNYYSDNTPSRFKNSITPIRFENGVDYETAIVNILLPSSKSGLLEVQKSDRNFEITFEIRTIAGNYETLFVYRPSRDIIGSAKDVVDKINKDIRSKYLYNITRRIEPLDPNYVIFDPRLNLIHHNFFKILNNRVCFYKNPDWREIYSEAEYHLMLAERNNLGGLRANEIYLEEWKEFTEGANSDETYRTITMSFGDGFARMFGFASNERYTIYDAFDLYPVTFRASKPLIPESDFLIIETDIVELTRYANRQTSILDAFPRDRQKLVPQILYKPLKHVSEINTISIMIHNEDGDLAEFDPNSVVILCLHIRPKEK